jgi:hypothetical protein
MIYGYVIEMKNHMDGYDTSEFETGVCGLMYTTDTHGEL